MKYTKLLIINQMILLLLNLGLAVYIFTNRLDAILALQLQILLIAVNVLAFINIICIYTYLTKKPVQKHNPNIPNHPMCRCDFVTITDSQHIDLEELGYKAGKNNVTINLSCLKNKDCKILEENIQS
jgi:ACR3 family arsenite efflux pump ArsB